MGSPFQDSHSQKLKKMKDIDSKDGSTKGSKWLSAMVAKETKILRSVDQQIYKKHLQLKRAFR